MHKKLYLSIFLIVLGVSAGLLVIFAYAMSGGKGTITLAFLAAAILCISVGSILGFSQLLDKLANPVADEIYKDIEDDIQDLKQHRITATIWMIVLTGIAALVFFFFVFRFHKVEATWGPIPVVLPTFVGMIVLVWFIPRTPWFQDQTDYTPIWVFLIPTAGLIISLMVGIQRTENLSLLRASRQAPVEYNSYPYGGLFLQLLAEASDVGSGLGLSNCDGDECGVLFLLIALVILTLILVIGSAFIPHFWVFSGSIMLSIMAVIAIHNLLIRRSIGDKTPYKSYVDHI
jgi:hypothetical protein